MIVQEKARSDNGSAKHLRLFTEAQHRQNRMLVPHVAKVLATEHPFGEFRMMAPSDLSTEVSYQRAISREAVLAMVRDFNPSLFQPLTISNRSRKNHVIDGQHRLAMAIELEIALVPCMVYAIANPSEEARLFVELQEKRRTLLSAQKFGAQIAYGDPVATELDKLFKKYRFVIKNGAQFSYSKGDTNEFRCLGVMRGIFKHGGRERCEFVLYIIRNAFDGSRDSQRREFVDGLARLHESADVTAKAVVETLVSKDLEPFEIVERVRRRAHNAKIGQPQAFVEIVTGFMKR